MISTEEEFTRRPLEGMSDREILEEMANNMRFCADSLSDIRNAIQSQGIMGLAKGLFGS